MVAAGKDGNVMLKYSFPEQGIPEAKTAIAVTEARQYIILVNVDCLHTDPDAIYYRYRKCH
jgi:hypothetical protein